ncbi:hypothetical protein [Bacillus mesophilum]|uniref:Uncharacterized protein n=1 Tax=Bacillus mesophilum TaxID=1071718 RepID=A0A7V7UW89_9BACI|nr:hypothetical protein [Bacillus mesophilum]KAB2334131.1 hypothetical protein F7732_08645 [Bacillus mesophilum]
MKTEINKQIVKNNMAAKLYELKTSRQVIEAYLEKTEEQENKDNEYIKSLIDRLTEAEEAKATATDKETVKKAIITITELTQEITLEDASAVAMANKSNQELSNLVETFFDKYVQARQIFNNLKYVFIAETSPKSIEADIAELKEIMMSINGSFAMVKSIMTDRKLVSTADRFFNAPSGKRVHLSQMGLEINKLEHLRQDIMPLLRELKNEGLL